MLTTPTNGWDEDTALLDKWGLKGMEKSTEHHRQETQNDDIFELQDTTTTTASTTTTSPELKLEQEMMQSNAEEGVRTEKESQPQLWS